MVNILLWVVQALLAALFLVHGGVLLANPAVMREAFAHAFAMFPAGFQQFIGIAELFGGAGLLLPHLTQIATWLTPTAASGLALIMVGAMGTHALHGELPQAIVSSVIVLLLVLVAWRRR